MNIHYLQHVPFEDMATIENWAIDRRHSISKTRLYNGERPPELEGFEWLVIMGGPMNIYEHEKHPWLVEEKKFIREAIAREKIVLGICLGAQLISDVLGGEVHQNKHREIGWHHVTLTPEASKSDIFRVLPNRFMAFQWHGDTFAIPSGAVRMAESDGCFNQAFQKGKAIGLQFHLESSKDSIDHLIYNCSDELKVDGKYVQKEDEIRSQMGHIPEMNRLMARFLDNIEREYGNDC